MSSPTPLLTILITQWGKADWLRACVGSITRQLPGDGSVQLLIGDDGVRSSAYHGPPHGGLSEEQTREAINAAIKPGQAPLVDYVRWNGREKRKNTLFNLDRTLDYARGRWVWVLGNNDAVYAGFLPRLLHSLRQADDDERYVYCRYAGYQAPLIGGERLPPLSPEHVEATEWSLPEIWGNSAREGRWSCLAQVAVHDLHAMTAIYAGLMRLSDWRRVAQLHRRAIRRGDVRWEDPDVTRPYATLILGTLLDKPCRYLAGPSLLMNYDSTWKAEEGAGKWRVMLDATRRELKEACGVVLSRLRDDGDLAPGGRP